MTGSAATGSSSRERQPQPVKPDRVVHHLTPAGRAELDRWLNEPSARLRGYRDDFFLKLMAAVQAGDPQTLDGVLRRQRTHLLRELHSLAEARQQAPSGVVELLITAAELHIRADLGVVDAAEKNLEPAACRHEDGHAQGPHGCGHGRRCRDRRRGSSRHDPVSFAHQVCS